MVTKVRDMLSVVSPLHPCRGNYANLKGEEMGIRDGNWRMTAGEYVLTQNKLDGVAKNIKEEWPTQMWIHQRKINDLLMSLIGKLREHVETLEEK